MAEHIFLIYCLTVSEGLLFKVLDPEDLGLGVPAEWDRAEAPLCHWDTDVTRSWEQAGDSCKGS